MDITELLAFSAKQGASDLHLSAGLPPMIRVDGDVRRVNVPALEHKQVHALIYDIMNDRQRKDYEEFLDGETRYEALKRTFPEHAKTLFSAAKKDAGAKYQKYKSLEEL